MLDITSAIFAEETTDKKTINETSQNKNILKFSDPENRKQRPNNDCKDGNIPQDKTTTLILINGEQIDFSINETVVKLLTEFFTGIANSNYISESFTLEKLETAKNINIATKQCKGNKPAEKSAKLNKNKTEFLPNSYCSDKLLDSLYSNGKQKSNNDFYSLFLKYKIPKNRISPNTIEDWKMRDDFSHCVEKTDKKGEVYYKVYLLKGGHHFIESVSINHHVVYSEARKLSRENIKPPSEITTYKKDTSKPETKIDANGDFVIPLPKKDYNSDQFYVIKSKDKVKLYKPVTFYVTQKVYHLEDLGDIAKKYQSSYHFMTNVNLDNYLSTKGLKPTFSPKLDKEKELLKAKNNKSNIALITGYDSYRVESKINSLINEVEHYKKIISELNKDETKIKNDYKNKIKYNRLRIDQLKKELKTKNDKFTITFYDFNDSIDQVIGNMILTKTDSAKTWLPITNKANLIFSDQVNKSDYLNKVGLKQFLSTYKNKAKISQQDSSVILFWKEGKFIPFLKLVDGENKAISFFHLNVNLSDSFKEKYHTHIVEATKIINKRQVNNAIINQEKQAATYTNKEVKNLRLLLGKQFLEKDQRIEGNVVYDNLRSFAYTLISKLESKGYSYNDACQLIKQGDIKDKIERLTEIVGYFPKLD